MLHAVLHQGDDVAAIGAALAPARPQVAQCVLQPLLAQTLRTLQDRARHRLRAANVGPKRSASALCLLSAVNAANVLPFGLLVTSGLVPPECQTPSSVGKLKAEMKNDFCPEKNGRIGAIFIARDAI